jgi:hypothetical protein
LPDSSQDGPDQGVEDVIGPWSVAWGTEHVVIRPIGAFTYSKIILPIEVVLTNAQHGTGLAIITLDPNFRFAVLLGAKIEELARFKRKVTNEVLAVAPASRPTGNDQSKT